MATLLHCVAIALRFGCLVCMVRILFVLLRRFVAS